MFKSCSILVAVGSSSQEIVDGLIYSVVLGAFSAHGSPSFSRVAVIHCWETSKTRNDFERCMHSISRPISRPPVAGGVL